jgi:putative transposase
VKLYCIRLRKPVEDEPIESFDGRLPDVYLNVMQFEASEDAERILRAWRIDDNGLRPHSSTGTLTPIEFARERQENGNSDAATF